MQHEPTPAIHMEKQVGWVRVSGGLQSRSNSVSEVDGVSDMAPAYQLHGFMRRGPRRGTMASAYLDASHLSLSQHATLAMELRESESE